MMKDYNSDSIIQLEGLEPVRLRPGMYIGSTDEKGLHHLIWEIVDNSIDEAMAGFASLIKIHITKKKSIIIEDNGRGIPTGINSKTKKSAIEMVFTELHAGGKFNNDSYSVSGGLHGVGASVVNALSEWLTVKVWQNGKEYTIKFSNGGKNWTKLEITDDNIGLKTGTSVEFYPDFSIMDQNDWNEKIIVSRIEQLSYLNKNLTINFKNEINGNNFSIKHSGGIYEWIPVINKDKESITSVIYGGLEKDVKINSKIKPMKINCELAFQYNKNYSDFIISFCNNINTTEGGVHEDGFKNAILKTINKLAFEKKILKDKDDKLSKDDVIEGLTAIISIKHPSPVYEGQTKRKLAGQEIRAVISELTQLIFEKFLYENPLEAELIIKKCLIAREARKKSFEAREAARRKSPFDNNSLPGKLADCTIKDTEISELFIVEGDSAGGSAKMGRDRYFQAILPLKGKVINVEKAEISKIFKNDEILDIVTVLGAGVSSEFDVLKVRYNKIIIMTDADVDGAHIRILLLTFLFRHMTALIEEGKVYIAQPPLYKFSVGKKHQYAFNEKTLEILKNESHNQKFTIQRYKGLGEMNPDQLWETTMDPTQRSLLKVSIDDAIIADKTFSSLMGEDVSYRKEFIEKNAIYVKNLDV
ncbi:MAG: DNA gyrase subunit B [Mycoplasmoidaceae bacterium]